MKTLQRRLHRAARASRFAGGAAAQPSPISPVARRNEARAGPGARDGPARDLGVNELKTNEVNESVASGRASGLLKKTPKVHF